MYIFVILKDLTQRRSFAKVYIVHLQEWVQFLLMYTFRPISLAAKELQDIMYYAPFKILCVVRKYQTAVVTILFVTSQAVESCFIVSEERFIDGYFTKDPRMEISNKMIYA